MRRRLRITAELLMELLKSLSPPLNPTQFVVEEHALPADSRLVEVLADSDGRNVVLVIESSEFTTDTALPSPVLRCVKSACEVSR